MIVIYLVTVFLFSSTIQIQANDADSAYYTAAVVEYESFWDNAIRAEDNFMKNVQNYEKYIEAAKMKQADIIVFPEMGLVADNTSYYVPVPEPKENVNPRFDARQHQALRRISAAARNSNIYVVINLLEVSRTQLGGVNYNTDVVFDRNGTIIARYRKYNLFEEPYCSSPPTPEHSYFDADFGVRFGIFTCFDILFPEPVRGLLAEYNITDVVYPTSWFSELPLMAATAVQAGWSYSTGVNLLASGQNNVTNYHSGTGIYAGKNGPLAYRLADEGGSFMLYHKVPKNGGHVRPSSKNSPVYLNGQPTARKWQGSKDRLVFFKEDMSGYETQLLECPEPGTEKSLNFKTELKICQGEFCCRFVLNYTVTRTGDQKRREDTRGDDFHFFRYRLAAMDGRRPFGSEDVDGIQVCAIVPCMDETLSSCGSRTDGPTPADRSLRTEFLEITVAGRFQLENTFVFPNVLGGSEDSSGAFGRLPTADQMAYETKTGARGEIDAVLLLKNTDRPSPMGVAGIYARLFDRDTKRAD